MYIYIYIYIHIPRHIFISGLDLRMLVSTAGRNFRDEDPIYTYTYTIIYIYIYTHTM